MNFYKPILRAVTDLSVMVKLSLVSGHIFCLFILIREVFSCHYPGTPFKSSVLWRRIKSPWQWYVLTCTASRNPTFQTPGQENLFVLKWKHLASKDYTSNNFQDFVGTVQYEYPYKECQKSPWTIRYTGIDLHHSAGQDFIIFSHQR